MEESLASGIPTVMLVNSFDPFNQLIQLIKLTLIYLLNFDISSEQNLTRFHYQQLIGPASLITELGFVGQGCLVCY